MVISDSYADYLLYPNEFIDKLTVNRILYRLYLLASRYDGTSTELTVTKATSSAYGLVKRSSLSSYQYMADDTETYYYRTIGIRQLLDYANGEYVKRSMYDIVGVNSELGTVAPKCLCISIGNCSYLHMPNGVRMVTFSFDMGVNGLFGMFGSDVASGSHEVPVAVGGHEEDIPLDSRTSHSLNSVYGNSTANRPLSAIFGSSATNHLSSTYLGAVTAAIRQHDCNWLSYSSYGRSRVELTYSVKFSVRDLYTKYHAFVRRTSMGTNATENSIDEFNVSEFNREFDAFQSNPIIIPQLAFYNTESMPDYYIGTYSNGDVKSFQYFSANDVGQNGLTESETAVRGRSRFPLPNASGEIILRGFDSDYRRNGHRRDNFVTFDVVFRFDAGDSSDPKKDISMKTIRAKANVQLMMIGV